jgi:hypothetical protein
MYQNSIQEEIKSRLKSGNARHHLVQNLLFFSLLSKNLKFYVGVKMIAHKREEHRLRVLRRIFGARWDEVTREWRKLHNKELNDLYSPSIVWVIKLRRMRWVGHVACMVERRGCTGLWWGNLRERDHLGDPGIDERIILRWIFRMWDVGEWTGLSWLRRGIGGVHL